MAEYGFAFMEPGPTALEAKTLPPPEATIPERTKPPSGAQKQPEPLMPGPSHPQGGGIHGPKVEKALLRSANPGAMPRVGRPKAKVRGIGTAKVRTTVGRAFAGRPKIVTQFCPPHQQTIVQGGGIMAGLNGVVGPAKMRGRSTSKTGKRAATSGRPTGGENRKRSRGVRALRERALQTPASQLGQRTCFLPCVWNRYGLRPKRKKSGTCD